MHSVGLREHETTFWNLYILLYCIFVYCKMHSWHERSYLHDSIFHFSIAHAVENYYVPSWLVLWPPLQRRLLRPLCGEVSRGPVRSLSLTCRSSATQLVNFWTGCLALLSWSVAILKVPVTVVRSTKMEPWFFSVVGSYPWNGVPLATLTTIYWLLAASAAQSAWSGSRAPLSIWLSKQCYCFND